MKTIDYARRLGAGGLLTDGKATYKISDWSPGTGTVYGWVQTPKGDGPYRRLPDNLVKAKP